MKCDLKWSQLITFPLPTPKGKWERTIWLTIFSWHFRCSLIRGWVFRHDMAETVHAYGWVGEWERQGEYECWKRKSTPWLVTTVTRQREKRSAMNRRWRARLRQPGLPEQEPKPEGWTEMEQRAERARRKHAVGKGGIGESRRNVPNAWFGFWNPPHICSTFDTWLALAMGQQHLWCKQSLKSSCTLSFALGASLPHGEACASLLETWSSTNNQYRPPDIKARQSQIIQP